jgi:glucosyl-3-phosphoglycerate synthase
MTESDDRDKRGPAPATQLSVVIPTLNEERTIERIVSEVVRSRHSSLVIDQVVVIDSGSEDSTVDLARRSGAEVVDHRHLIPWAGARSGKGEALWKSLSVVRNEIVVFLDGDLQTFNSHWVYALACPLVRSSDVSLVKGAFERPFGSGGDHDGGRVTELLVRPALWAYFPELGFVAQPMAGEFAARKTDLMAIPFAPAYAVDLGILLDMYLRRGVASIEQVELGRRVHRHQPLFDLSRMGATALHTILRRNDQPTPADHPMIQPSWDGGHLQLSSWQVPIADRPPMSELLQARVRQE